MKKYKSIFTESAKKYEFTIPTWAVNYIENGEVRDINEKEQKQIATNGWRYGVGLPCRLFHLTTTVNGKLHYTACCVSGAVKLRNS